jgi:hypothetical protein
MRTTFRFPWHQLGLPQRSWAHQVWFGLGSTTLGLHLIQALVIFCLALMVYSSGSYFQAGDTIPAELLPISIIRDGDLDLSEFVAQDQELPYWFKRANGKILSYAPVMPGILNTPVYIVGDWLNVDLMANRFSLSLWSASIITAMSALLIYFCLLRICERRGRRCCLHWYMPLVRAHGVLLAEPCGSMGRRLCLFLLGC